MRAFIKFAVGSRIARLPAAVVPPGVALRRGSTRAFGLRSEEVGPKEQKQHAARSQVLEEVEDGVALEARRPARPSKLAPAVLHGDDEDEEEEEQFLVRRANRLGGCDKQSNCCVL